MCGEWGGFVGLGVWFVVEGGMLVKGKWFGGWLERGVVFTATLSKMIREFMPSEVRLAGDAMDMIIECCTG